MKPKTVLISGALFMASWMSSGVAFSQSSKETIHPDLNESKGGSKSERNQSGVPLPKGDPSTGTVEQGKSSSTDPVRPRASETERDASKRSGGDTTKGKDTDQPNQPPQTR